LANAEPSSLRFNQKKEDAPHDDHDDVLTKALIDVVTKTTDRETATTSDNMDTIICHNRNVSLIDALRTIAVASNMWISSGGMHVIATTSKDDGCGHDNGSGKVYNTHIILDNTGAIRAEYRKIHLFDVSIPGRFDLQESKTTRAGTQLVVCPDSPIGKGPLSNLRETTMTCNADAFSSYQSLCTLYEISRRLSGSNGLLRYEVPRNVY
jgi:hypothetical protein